MNIQRAKQEIIHTVRAYTAKDGCGSYRIPVQRQRPILLIGPPGIGKTEIVRQAAEECQVGFVAYTITHHTRQSAVGLPVIESATFDGETYEVTRYTMSEIIGSLYKCMEQTGKREGILFIDEINCVSETLMPTMLQLLQGKTFGEYAVPEGWVIVTAGNPYVYNTSVREFDMVTLDRVKRLDVEPDYRIWRAYARKKKLHGAVLFYLECRQDRFYYAKREQKTLHFVTARGWEDLSDILTVYEEQGTQIDVELIGQYLQCEEIAQEFYSWYRLYVQYGEDFSHIMSNDEKIRGNLQERMHRADWEERSCLIEYGFSKAAEQTQRWKNLDMQVQAAENMAGLLTDWIRRREKITDKKDVAAFVEEQKKAVQIKKKAGLLSAEQGKEEAKKLWLLDELYTAGKKEQAVKAEDWQQIADQWIGRKKEACSSFAADCHQILHRLLELFFTAWHTEQMAEYTRLLEALSKHEATVLFFHRYKEPLYKDYLSGVILADEKQALLQDVGKLLEKKDI